MFDSNDLSLTNQPASNFVFKNVDKILSTFIPADHGRQSHNLYTAIGIKSHGTITFSDNKSNRAEFIRIPPDAPVMEVKELLNQQWCRGRPSLVISVTGGAKDYNMKPKLLRAFRRGLLKVARTTGNEKAGTEKEQYLQTKTVHDIFSDIITGAWIITGGMNTGIMKLVGEIVQINPDRFRPIHLIGIATWGCVSGFQQLDVNGANVQYTKPRSEGKGAAAIEPNHTEFIFIDDGSERKYGREIAFRARLEQAISGDFFGSRPTTNTSPFPSLSRAQSLHPEQSDPVPVVLLVVEGGPNTVRTVHEAVVQNNIPAVFFEGTGRCCDLFAKAFRLYNEYRPKFELSDDTSHLDPDLVSGRYSELKNKLREELKVELLEISGVGDVSAGNAGKTLRKNDKKPRAVDETDYFELVYECINTRINFLNIVSLNSRSPAEPDIDLAILQALLKATSSGDPSKTSSQRKREQFHLALEWNRVDIVKNYIMKDVGDWAKINLNDIFVLALSRNQTEFVKLFLDHDFSLTDVFRKKEILPLLYYNSKNEHPEFTSIPADSLRMIYKEIIQPLIGDFFEVDVALRTQRYSSRNRLDLVDEDEGCSCCATSRTIPTDDLETGIEREESMRSEVPQDNYLDVDKELFIWSVVTGRRDFNLLFWARGKNKICAALFAALVYRKRARKDNDNSYYKAADEFEKLAVQILERFHQANARACTKAIIRQIPAYGNVTWLELAVTAEAKEFIAQRVVQDVLSNIWYGYIDHRESERLIIFSTIMLWYSGFLRYHNELVKTNEQTTFLDESLGKSKLLQQYHHTTKRKHTKDRLNNDVQMRLMHGIADAENTPVDFVTVGCCEKTSTGISRYFENIVKFIRAPYVKYLYSLYFHLIFLLLFSYMMLCDFYPLYDSQVDTCSPAASTHRRKGINHNHITADNDSNTDQVVAHVPRIRDRPAMTEFILAIWIFTLFCEETRQFFGSEAHTIRNKIVAYFEEFWNILDILAILLFYIGFILRFLRATECFCAARIVLSVDLAIWFIRSLTIFAAVKRLGPKLVMIGEMTNDLKVFMVMLTVFILGFGVSSYSLIYGAKDFSWHLPREIINLAYWQMFGELNALDAFEHNYRANGYAAFILLVLYMAIVSILLVNLLIAMFSNTFNRLENDTDRIWKFQRYSLICEYLTRPSLPPPFIFLSHVGRFILYTLTPCLKSSWLKTKFDQHTSRTSYKIVLDEKSATNIEIAEDALGDEVYYNYLKIGRKLIDENDLNEERVQSPQEIMLNKIRTLEERMQMMNHQQAHVFEYLDSIMDGLRLLGGEQIRVPERRRFDPDESFDETSATAEQFRQNTGRESNQRYARRASVQSDDQQSPIINFFPSRRTE